MRRSAGHAAGDRKTMAVCDRHDFAAFAAASRADSSAPFFAELKLASMKVSDKSILPRARRSSASVCNSPSQRAIALPLLETPMTGLIGWIRRRKIVPLCAGAQNPKHSVEHRPRIAPRPSPPVGPSLRSKQWLEFLPLPARVNEFETSGHGV